MKVSFITTVLNEEKTIKRLLRSIINQTRVPDEGIIVDGESLDKTLSRIFNFQFYPRPELGSKAIFNKDPKTKKIKFIVLIKKGNRSVGRNEAIGRAKGDIIVCTDAGCIADKNWVRNITEPFSDKTVDVVAGYYKPIANTVFEKCLATYTSVMPDKVNSKNFLPSSRSVSFRKEVWKNAGGYPEYLDTCEDLVFAKKLKKMGFKFHFAGNAIVYWPQRKNLKEAFWQFFNYARGDGQAYYFRPQTPFLFGRYLLGSLLLILFLISKQYFILNTLYLILIFYIFWSILKNYKYVKNLKALFWLPVLQIVSDLAVILGMTIGLLKSLMR